MHIKILMVGKIRERYLQDGVSEYLKRLSPYARMELISVGDEPIPEGASMAQEGLVKAKEGEKIAKQLDSGQYVVALDMRGKLISSEDLAEFLAERALRGESNLAFIIGGSLGLSAELLQRADARFSLGRITFLHQMVPLVLLEQIYRGYKINRGETYHK